jgi:hypothetical protein
MQEGLKLVRPEVARFKSLMLQSFQPISAQPSYYLPVKLEAECGY